MNKVRMMGMALGLALLAATAQAKSPPMTDAEFDQKLKQAVKELNAKLPVMMDEETRLERGVAGPGRAISYIYTLVNTNADEIDAAEFARIMQPDLKNQACGSPVLKAMFTGGIKAHFVYNGKDGVEITRLTFAAADCGITPAG